MGLNHVAAALLATQVLAGTGFAQSAAVFPAEYGRASGGQISVLGKQASRLSGSFGLMTSRSADPFAAFGSGSDRGIEATLGGTIVEDRAWFFASTRWSESPVASRFGATSQGVAGAGKITAQLGDRNLLISSFRADRDLNATAPVFVAAPASLLSFHYTGIVSSNMFFTANVSRSKAPRSQQPLDLVQP